MITTLIDLGWCIGKLKIHTSKGIYDLVIVSPSDANEDAGYSVPAESICLYGKRSLINLQKALNEAFPS